MSKVITVYRYRNDEGIQVCAEVWPTAEPGEGVPLDTAWFDTRKEAMRWCRRSHPGVRVLYSTDLHRADRRYIDRPGHCKFCGCIEYSHDKCDDGSEHWKCPRCGNCADYHIDEKLKKTASELAAAAKGLSEVGRAIVLAVGEAVPVPGPVETPQWDLTWLVGD